MGKVLLSSFVRMLTGQPQGLILLCLWTWYYCGGSGLLIRLLSLRKSGSNCPPLTVPVSASSHLFYFTGLLDVGCRRAELSSWVYAAHSVDLCASWSCSCSCHRSVSVSCLRSASTILKGPGSRCTKEIGQLAGPFSAFPFPHPLTATSQVK